MSVVIVAAESILLHYFVYGQDDCLERSVAHIRYDILFLFSWVF